MRYELLFDYTAHSSRCNQSYFEYFVRQALIKDAEEDEKSETDCDEGRELLKAARRRSIPPALVRDYCKALGIKEVTLAFNLQTPQGISKVVKAVDLI